MFQRLPSRGAFALLPAVLVTVVACSALLPDEPLPADPPGGQPSAAPSILSPADPAAPLPPPNPCQYAGARPSPGPTSGRSGGQPPAPSTIGTGHDGRVTILLLGSDKRENVWYPGERTDVVLVASIVPSTKRITLASVSRGAVRWPIAPDNRTKWMGASNSGGTKLSEIYQKYYPRFDPNKVMPVHFKALHRLKADVAYGLGIEIDYWA